MPPPKKVFFHFSPSSWCLRRSRQESVEKKGPRISFSLFVFSLPSFWVNPVNCEQNYEALDSPCSSTPPPFFLDNLLFFPRTAVSGKKWMWEQTHRQELSSPFFLTFPLPSSGGSAAGWVEAICATLLSLFSQFSLLPEADCTFLSRSEQGTNISFVLSSVFFILFLSFFFFPHAQGRGHVQVCSNRPRPPLFPFSSNRGSFFFPPSGPLPLTSKRSGGFASPHPVFSPFLFYSFPFSPVDVMSLLLIHQHCVFSPPFSPK